MATDAHLTPVEIDGRTIRLTNLDKVMYPETGTTKAEVIDYYRAVAPWLVRHNARRPATRKRWVDGVGTPDAPGKAFFSKNLDSGTPDWVDTVTLEHRERDVTYPLVDDAATLVWLAQVASLEIHVPQWRVGPRGGHQNPDRLVLDLDPGEGVDLDGVVRVALLCKEILDGMSLASVPVTSGSKGIHLYAALDGGTTTTQATTVAHELAKALEAEHPDLVVSDMKRALRPGKVFIDWSQNNAGKTTVAPYSLRGRMRPYVAAPRSWDELTAGVSQLDFEAVLRRLADGNDPLAALLPREVRAGANVGSTGTAGSVASSDPLASYRSKRDAAKTPEPVPDERPAATAGNSFVIQEHHASSLHWDFRLEHDGVLVSWALPKGPPTDPKKNHLAVQTEDHPLEFGSFEGTIPQGEYGGGKVRIWDAGSYDCEKWIDGKEIIAVLHGREGSAGGLGGTAKFALIHTGRGSDKQWLIHRMALPEARPATPPEARPDAQSDPPTVEPMLAILGSADDLTGKKWSFETKWDGYRAIATIANGEARFTSRNGLDVSATYPELQEIIGALGGHAAVLDGEIVALDKDGRSAFGRLQNRGDSSLGVRAHYMVFDLLWLDGESLLRTPYADRRAALERLGIAGDHVHVPVTLGTDAESALRTSRELHLEGVVAKTVDGVYQPGTRARTWIKIKNVRAQEVLVVGWIEGSGARAGGIGSLLLAVNGDRGLEYVGKVGTGFTAASLRDIAAQLNPLERKTAPLDGVPRADAKSAHWVTPKLVGEVAYSQWTSAGRLRHSSWRGWRPDKDPDQVIRADG